MRTHSSMQKRATIKDVAREAGVSKVTVSYVLSGQAASARISDATSQRVLAAAEALGYAPNALARSMVTKRSDALGVVFQYASFFTARSDFVKEVMAGITQASVTLGYDLMLHTRPLLDPRSEVGALTDGRVDGLLILRDENDPTLQLILKRDFPSVLFFTKSEDPSVAYVDSENYLGGRMAVEHLIGLGHRRIGMLHGSLHSTATRDRLRGALDVMQEHGLEVEDRYVANLSTGVEMKVISGFLRTPDRPSAIFCFSDEYAMYCLKAAAELGIPIPEDLSIVGFDSLDWCDTSNPPLTSIRQPVMEMARAATELLVKLIRGEPVKHVQMTFSTALDVRGSTAPPKS